MISNPKKVCVEPRCRDPAIYGVNRAVHCVLHKLKGEESLLGGRCVACNLIDILDARSLCSSCDPDAFQRVRLAKQREVKLWLDNTGHGDYVVYDRVTDNGECGRERPDFAYDCGTHWVILEVDEHQHEDRQEVCECTRMVNISQSVGTKTVFIRYNPDAFKSGGRQQNPGISRRRGVLLKWLGHLRKVEPEYFLSALHLFYDNYDEGVTVVEPVIRSERVVT